MRFFGKRPALVERLVRHGLLDREQARQAEASTTATAPSLPQFLIESEWIGEAKLFEFMADNFTYPPLGSDWLHLDEALQAALPKPLQSRTDLLVLKKTGRVLTLAMADPTDTAVIDQIESQTRYTVRPVLAPWKALRELNERQASLAALRSAEGNSCDLSQFMVFFEKLEDYRFESLLGEGGFGIVCRCRQISLDRPVAIKVLNPNWNPIEQVAERFRREGRIIARLDQPNIIRVFEQGEREGVRYIVMEYFEGIPIDDYLRDKDWGRKLNVLRQVCAALEFAHGKGIIHRDVKPGNILVNHLGAIKLLDFGVAHHDPGSDSALTTPQIVLGTPRYMAPELDQGAHNSSPASDIYAFGVMTYEIMTGRRLKAGELVHPCKLEPQLPQSLGNLLLTCLSTRPSVRPASFEIIRKAMQAAMDQLVFGKTAVVSGERGGVQLDEDSEARPVDYKSVLRDDEHCKTYIAYHQSLGQDVVIKRLRDATNLDHYMAFANLEDFNIGTIYGIGESKGTLFIIGEYFEGGALTRLMHTPLAPHDVAHYLQGIVGALHRADLAGLYHGHLHPQNIMVTAEGVVKVVDFGLYGGESEIWRRYRPRRKTTDPRQLDRHALGALAYEMLTGEDFPYRREYDEIFATYSENPLAPPPFKHFLGRLWEVGPAYPPFENYADMQLALERIGRRVNALSQWEMQEDGPDDRQTLPIANTESVESETIAVTRKL